MKEIKITFTEEGPVVEADGFQGPACVQLLDELLQGTGLLTGSYERKPEYHEEQSQLVAQR